MVLTHQSLLPIRVHPDGVGEERLWDFLWELWPSSPTHDQRVGSARGFMALTLLSRRVEDPSLC